MRASNATTPLAPRLSAPLLAVAPTKSPPDEAVRERKREAGRTLLSYKALSFFARPGARAGQVLPVCPLKAGPDTLNTPTSPHTDLV